MQAQRSIQVLPERAVTVDDPVLTSAFLQHGGALHSEIERTLCGESELTAICRYAVVPTGKLFRPILLLESAMAVGGDPQMVIPAAAGTEYGHVASLIHDDVIDGDDMRRGRPSVQYQYGVENAIVSGDSLLFSIFLCLAACRERGVPDDRIVSALRVVAQAGVDLCEGQNLEAQIRGDLSSDIDKYLTMIRLKTSALFRASCESGAILGGGSEDQVQALATYGDSLGTAFQIWDDLLAYLSDSATMGKAATSDIRNQRITLPVIFAQRCATPAQRHLLEQALRGTESLPGALDRVRQLILGTGAVDACRALAMGYVESALEVLEALEPSPSRDRLASFAMAVVDRAS